MKLAARRIAITLLFCSGMSPLFTKASMAGGKDLSQRFGFGIANIGPDSRIPSLSIDWQASRATAFEFNLGINTTNDSNLLLLDLRYSRNLYIEDQQYYFLYVGGGLLSQQISGANKSGYILESGGGAKFFTTGLPNLGFSFRGGIELQSAGGVSFQSVVSFGIHYYF